jgi:hypothetical protein
MGAHGGGALIFDCAVRASAYGNLPSFLPVILAAPEQSRQPEFERYQSECSIMSVDSL